MGEREIKRFATKILILMKLMTLKEYTMLNMLFVNGKLKMCLMKSGKSVMIDGKLDMMNKIVVTSFLWIQTPP